jgi:hypothetical protein
VRVRGPSIGRLHLDLDLSAETGVAWTSNISTDALLGGGAALAGRFPLSHRWNATVAVGYERVSANGTADLLAVWLEFSRRFGQDE